MIELHLFFHVKNFYFMNFLSLIRHAEYDPASGRLTTRGSDSIGLIAQHLNQITKSPANDRIAPVNVIASSQIPRAVKSRKLLLETMRVYGASITDAGEHGFLNENYYPEIYQKQSIHEYNFQLNTEHFYDLINWVQEQKFRHIALVTHAPVIHSITCALIHKRKGAQGNLASDETAYNAEHLTRPSLMVYGQTTVFKAKNWQDMFGFAELIGDTFSPLQSDTKPPKLDISKLRADRRISKTYGT